MKTLIRNARLRRRISLGFLVAGGALFMLAPGNASAGLLLAGLGALIEIVGITLKHTEG